MWDDAYQSSLPLKSSIIEDNVNYLFCNTLAAKSAAIMKMISKVYGLTIWKQGLIVINEKILTNSLIDYHKSMFLFKRLLQQNAFGSVNTESFYSAFQAVIYNSRF